MDMPFPAYQRLFELVMNAVTGQYVYQNSGYTGYSGYKV